MRTRPIVRSPFRQEIVLCALVCIIALQSSPPESGAAYGTPAQQSGPDPCLAPSAEDLSRLFLAPSHANSTLQKNVVPEVQSNAAKPVTRMLPDKVMSLEIDMNLRNKARFEDCLHSIYDPSSPNYHHFLNKTSLLPYLPTPGQKNSLASFLESQGYRVANSTSPLALRASAPVSTVEKTFGINMRVYHSPVHGGVAAGGLEKAAKASRYSGVFYAADSAPTLPSNIAALVSSVRGLDNYTIVRPLESPCTGPYCPQGIQAGYGLPGLYGSGLDGKGSGVALVDCAGDPNPQAAIDTYDGQYGLPKATLDISYPDGRPSSYDAGWASETMMDVEAAHAVAPGAQIDLVYVACSSGAPIDGIDYVATNHVAGIVSNSWGLACSTGPCSDTELDSTLVSSSDDRLALDSAQGLAILFSSGDSGATPDGTNLGTDFPASDPNVLAVGATDLVLAGCKGDTCTGYGSETGAKISGGGYSGYFEMPPWQKAVIGTSGGRAVPDVSMLGLKPAFWVYSTKSDKCGTAFFASSGWFGCAGTSLSSPLWAGYLAIVQQAKGGVPLGNVAPTLYGMYNSTSYTCSFHGIVSGDNKMSGNKGYEAGPGWNPVTGLGTPVSDNLTWVLDGGTCAAFVPEFGPNAWLLLSVATVAAVSLARFRGPASFWR